MVIAWSGACIVCPISLKAQAGTCVWVFVTAEGSSTQSPSGFLAYFSSLFSSQWDLLDLRNFLEETFGCFAGVRDKIIIII